jgi:hypothetical protein
VSPLVIVLQRRFNCEEACGILPGFDLAAWHEAVLKFTAQPVSILLDPFPESDIQSGMHVNTRATPSCALLYSQYRNRRMRDGKRVYVSVKTYPTASRRLVAD